MHAANVKRLAVTEARLVELVAANAGRARVVITGTSMMPSLRAGMVVDVEPLEYDPRIGDILVFRSQRGLVAHRLVERSVSSAVGGEREFVTAGDAHPDRLERVPARLVVGRVTAVRSGDERNAKRVDGPWFARAGRVYARTRSLRATCLTARRIGASIFTLPLPPRAFAALARASFAFEARRLADGVDALRAVPERFTIATGRAHHASGMIACWLDDAARAGVAVPSGLTDAFGRTRFSNALQAGRVLQTVRDVRDRFRAADVPCVFLKGGARLAAGESGAELHFSCDVDVLVPASAIERALAALRAAGYRDLFGETRRAKFESHHHRSPLRAPNDGAPVEVHVALADTSVVSERLDFDALAAHRRSVDGPVGSVVVFDDVVAAVHLAYHARDLHVWRDVVFLARKLAVFSNDERARFDALVGAETRDATRLASAVAAADFMNARTTTSRAPHVKRYLAWATLREDLPRGRSSCDVVESFVGRCAVASSHVAKLHGGPARLRYVLKNVAFMPFFVRALCCGVKRSP